MNTFTLKRVHTIPPNKKVLIHSDYGKESIYHPKLWEIIDTNKQLKPMSQRDESAPQKVTACDSATYQGQPRCPIMSKIKD